MYSDIDLVDEIMFAEPKWRPRFVMAWKRLRTKLVESWPTVRAKRPVQQAKESIMPADYEYCPHCRGSFSFAKLGSNFRCKWCKKDVRTSGRLA